MHIFFLWLMRVVVMVLVVLWGRQTIVASRTGEYAIAFFLFAFLFALYGFAAWFKKRGRI